MSIQLYKTAVTENYKKALADYKKAKQDKIFLKLLIDDPELQEKLKTWALWDFCRINYYNDRKIYEPLHSKIHDEIMKYKLGQFIWDMKYLEKEQLKKLSKEEIQKLIEKELNKN